MLFSVPGDPKHLLFAAKAELQYIKISIFLLDGISIHSDGGLRGGRKEAGREGRKMHFYFESRMVGTHRGSREAAWTTEAEDLETALGMFSPSPVMFRPEH